jgi:Zn-dependent protease with chaperone function
MTSGAGIFFDGATSARHDVTIELAPAALQIRSGSGEVLAEWSYDEIVHLSAHDGVLRVGRRKDPRLARLEIRDPAFAAAVDEIAAAVDRTGVTQQRQHFKVAVLMIAAVASFAFVALLAIPALATRLTPLLPQSVERKFGEVINVRLRDMLDTGGAGTRFECGEAAAEMPGRGALQSLLGRLEAAAALPFELRVSVVRRAEVNAVALPGGHIYLFEGLITKAEGPDELAGVIAHEIGHVVRRDGVKSVLQAAGLSFLFGMLLGDFVGGGAVVMAARTLVQSSYSRETEAATDAYAVTLMNQIGGDANALGRMLSRVADTHGSGSKIFSDHPETGDRIAAIRSMAAPASGKPLLSDAQWAAVKRICAGQ